ncbi:MAG: hypothetical protein CL569_01700 [Alphaproteobacteria bacterium]|nr:hypothetical protein [Alphaproteobacteria bacterium]
MPRARVTQQNRPAKLYFAYGSNMHMPSMRIRCPRARLLSTAMLSDWEFFINTQGYASIRPVDDQEVHGALWTIGPREEAALNLYEDIADQLYLRVTVNVISSRETYRDVLTYVATNRRPGRPRAGYMPLVHESAEQLDLPEGYRDFLRTWD